MSLINSILNNDALYNVFIHQPEENICNLGLVCKRWYIITELYPQLYSDEHQATKKYYFEFIRLQREILEKSAPLNKQIVLLENILNKTKQELSTLLGTWGLFSLVPNLLSAMSQKYRNELDKQVFLEHKCKVIQRQICKVTEDRLRALETTPGFQEVNEQLRQAKDRYKSSKAVLINVIKIRKLFGGRKGFEKLPILDIGDRVGVTGYIDFIKPEEMTTPIMRGKDVSGRNFFTFRARHKALYFVNFFSFLARSSGDNKLMCQTIFQRDTNSSSWVSGAKGEMHPMMIDFDLSDTDSYKELHTLISTGRVTVKPAELSVEENTYVLE